MQDREGVTKSGGESWLQRTGDLRVEWGETALLLKLGWRGRGSKTPRVGEKNMRSRRDD